MVVVRSTRNTELGLQATLALLIGAPPAGCPPPIAEHLDFLRIFADVYG